MTTIAAGNDGYSGYVSAPGCISSAVTVGATTDGSRETVAGFSNSAAIVDLLAPGTLITSAIPGGGFASLPSTSMAAPHVAGAWAAIRSKSPSMTAAAIEQALKSTGKPLKDGGFTMPRIDLAAALGLMAPPAGGWGAWASLGGSLASQPECEASGSRIDCWAPGTSGTLLWNRTEDGDHWRGWQDLGGSASNPPDCMPVGSGLDCFVITAAGKLAQNHHDGSLWTGWSEHGGSLRGRPSCVASSHGGFDCLAQGVDKALWHIAFDGITWQAWQKVGGKLASRPECLARSGGVDCFFVAGGKLQTRRLAAGKWGKAIVLTGGAAAAPPHCLAEAGHIDCFAQGSASQLLKGYFNGKRWQGWTKVASSTVAIQPTCLMLGSDFACFWTSRTGHLVERHRVGGSWLAELSHAGIIRQRPACLVQNGGARIDCLARGQDGSLLQKTYRATPIG